MENTFHQSARYVIAAAPRTIACSLPTGQPAGSIASRQARNRNRRAGFMTHASLLNGWPKWKSRWPISCAK